MIFYTRFLESRFWALCIKEVNQILRNKQLLFLLLFPPTIQLLIFGFALNADVQNLKLGIVDYANTYESRELVAALTENQIFIPHNYSLSQEEIAQQVRLGQITAGLVIPPEFNRNLAQNKTAEVQIFIDGVDANTAGIASGYAAQIINQYSRSLDENPTPPLVQAQSVFFYNPGLLSSWFLVPGVLGTVITLTSTLVSSTTLVREKDSGTLEQLLMTPADAWEILLAKIAPLFVLLMGDILLALSVARIVFRVPLQGSLLLFLALGGLYLFVGIGVGLMLATLAKNQQQVVLTSFFINLPLIQLSGAIAPIESMPVFFQYLSLLNPLRHFVAISRGILLKGVGIDILFPHVLALFTFVVVLLTVSINRFRSQLS
ncbi:ABC transporter permease [Gloeocapsopsis crepidinum LEGE 06123]|uniref:Transport permease protein n=1 Tax=Gloeocapsopsis crepidinum LEGE 06123 TaxID=588587 RepID=A0ABR9UYP5_9CHRO|nr:ABC transporter permease [Gloeocapsopsis crepidinum]MBE9193440.1 ABC transporter permease [Gloeocapsopsis crepidinum LEGE 06123]